VRDVYRKKAADKKNYHDVTVRHTVAVTASVGTIPDAVMREYLPQANFQDANGSLIAYLPYPVDYNSTVKYTQIGYVSIQGDSFLYTAPSPNQSYTGNLYVTVQTMPTLPTNWATTLDIDTDVLDDIILALAMAIRGQYQLIIPEQ
jgi:hypothetical protein